MLGISDTHRPPPIIKDRSLTHLLKSDIFFSDSPPFQTTDIQDMGIFISSPTIINSSTVYFK